MTTKNYAINKNGTTHASTTHFSKRRLQLAAEIMRFIITPLNFFLWGYVKDKVYADAPQSIQKLKEMIRTVIDEIEPQMFRKCNGKFQQKSMILQMFFIINGKPSAIE